MNKSFFLCVIITIVVTGCVSTHMKQYIGKDIRYVSVDSGPPINTIDMPDGRRAFQYYWGGGKYYVPKTTNTQGQVQVIGNSAHYSENKIESGGVIIDSKGCLITYFTEWNSELNGWIVVDISYPARLVC